MALFKKKRKLGATSLFKARYRHNLEIPKRKKTAVSRKTSLILSDRPSAKIHRVPLKKFTIVTGLLVIIAIVMHFTIVSDYFVVKKISAKFDEAETADQNIDITPHTQKYLQSNILFLKSDLIEKNITKDYPQISKIKIKKILPGQVVIDIKTYPIVANVINKLGNRQKKFQILSSGYLIKEGSEDPALPYIIISSETTFQTLTKLIPPEKLSYMIESAKAFNQKFNLRVIDSEYLPIAREVRHRTEKNFTVWLDIEQSWENQLNKLKRALPKLDIYQTPLQYIDLRITSANGEKIYYK